MQDPETRLRTLGQQELEALEEVRARAPVTVGEMFKAFGEPRGLARTTVLTVMERLRKKGFIQRTKEEGIFRYSPKPEPEEALKGLVADFVRRSLGGSLSPFVSYLVDSGDLNPNEVEQLKRLIEKGEPGKGA